MKKLLFTLVFVSLAVTLARAAAPDNLDKTGTFGGITVNYKVVLPAGYDPARAYPGVLVFAGGSQNADSVNRMVERSWRAEAEQRGYIIISPAAPPGKLFFLDGDHVFPAFVDQLLKDYKIEGGKLHIAGASNGGISAFHIAAMYPQYFKSVTGYPGYLPEMNRASVLKPMCIYMHVGSRDSEWLAVMREESVAFRRMGLRVHFSVHKDQEHSIETLTGAGAKRLFDQLEESDRGCN